MDQAIQIYEWLGCRNLADNYKKDLEKYTQEYVFVYMQKQKTSIFNNLYLDYHKNGGFLYEKVRKNVTFIKINPT